MARIHWRTTPLLLALAAAAPAQPALTSDDFFDGSRLHDLRLEMDPADWQKLKDNYLESTYYRCRLDWNGIVVENVAVKSRGSGSRNPIKPGLGLDFSKFASSQRFLGMKSVVLRNSVQDPSMVHERVAMEVFRKAGLPSLREAHARVFVNGNYAGLYLMVEPIDSKFLSSRFGENDGYLYEFNFQGDGYHWEYLGDDPALYVPGRFEPKNHEDNPGGEWLAAMLKAISLSSDEEFVAEAGRYLDLDNFTVHAATEAFLAEWDGLMGDTGTTNFYFYRRKADDRGMVLVWDKEASCSIAEWNIWTNVGWNAVMKRLIAVTAYRELYMNTLASLAAAAGPGGGWLASEVDRQIDQIRTAAMQDPYPVCDGGAPGAACQDAERLRAWDEVRGFAAYRAQVVERMLAEAGYEWAAPAARR